MAPLKALQDDPRTHPGSDRVGQALKPVCVSHGTEVATSFHLAQRGQIQAPHQMQLAGSRLRYDAPWAHLKVLTSDTSSAYIGSANFMGAGLSGHNLELGVLVPGPAVSLVEQVLDLFREQSSDSCSPNR